MFHLHFAGKPSYLQILSSVDLPSAVGWITSLGTSKDAESKYFIPIFSDQTETLKQWGTISIDFSCNIFIVLGKTNKGGGYHS